MVFPASRYFQTMPRMTLSDGLTSWVPGPEYSVPILQNLYTAARIFGTSFNNFSIPAGRPMPSLNVVLWFSWVVCSWLVHHLVYRWWYWSSDGIFRGGVRGPQSITEHIAVFWQKSKLKSANLRSVVLVVFFRDLFCWKLQEWACWRSLGLFGLGWGFGGGSEFGNFEPIFVFLGFYLANLQIKMVYFCLSCIIKAYFKKMKKF